ncbi:MAG: ATP-binding cassette domain-containing protein [candidate division WOR-3 bacterium]
MNPVIKVENLHKIYRRPLKEKGLKGSIKEFFKRKYEEVHALKGISFEVYKGEILGFIGPNGAGKTTCMKILSGVLYKTKGFVNVLGFDPFKREKEFLKKITFVMGLEGFLEEIVWDISARDGLYFIKDLYEVDDKVFKNNLNEMAEVLDVKDILDVPIRKISKGQKMRLELIASLIYNPEVLFLDEPTLGLDIVSQKNIREFIKYYVDKNKATCILTSHYMKDVEELSDRLIIINKGEIIYEGKVKGAIEKFSGKKLIKFSLKNENDKEKLKKFYSKIHQDEEEEGIYRILVNKYDAPLIAKDLFQNFEISDIVIEEPELEEVLRDVFENSS